MLTLTSLNGQDKGREFQLTGEKPELLGRQAPNIKLADAQTSRKHAEVLLENNTWLIRDLDSTNGTWVNGQKIIQITELEVGDRIVIGRHQFRVSAISDVPAPSPKPLPLPHEPLLGDEELGEMGVDLGESLSADILDDVESDLPEIPESAIDDDAEQAPPPAEQVVESPSELDEGVIDLDALLDEGADEDHGHATSTPPESEPSSEPDQPIASALPDEDGIIDLDNLLADESASPTDEQAVESVVENEPATESPAEESSRVDVPEPPVVPPVILDEPASEPVVENDNVDFDLDELLSEEPEDQPSAAEPAVDDAPQEELAADADAPVKRAVEEPIDDTPPDIPLPADTADDQESDSIDDIDALLDDLGTDLDHAEEDDVLGSAEPPVLESPDQEIDEAPPPDTQTPDTQNPDTQDVETVDESSGDIEADSLIDIDILAAATPSVPLSESEPDAEASADEPSAPDAQPVDEQEDQPQSSDESGVFSDDSGMLGVADTGMDMDDAPSAELDDSVGEMHDTNQSTGITEPQAVDETEADDDDQDAIDDGQDDPLASDIDDEAEILESERELLLTEQEQSQAVTGYKRSKLISLVVVVLISVVVGTGGWYAFNHLTHRADANDQRSPANSVDQVTTPANPIADNQTRPPVQTTKQDTGPAVIPDITAPKPKTGRVGIPDIPDKTSAADVPTNETTQNASPKPPTGRVPIPDIVNTQDTAPETPDPTDTESSEPTAPADKTQAPDPFEDVDTSVFDTPPGDDAGSSNTAVEPVTTEVINDPPIEPEPTVQPDAVIDTPANAQAQGDLSPIPEPAPAANDTALPAGPTSAQNGEDNLPNTTPGADSTTPDSNEAQLSVLAGIIDAQNKPGVGVNEQAAFAGARRIIYLVDASGSLVDSFPRVLNELNFEIDNLDEDQAFTAIFFGAEGVTEIPPNGLKWADPPTKRDSRNWIDPDSGNVTAWGRGDLMQALKLATDYGADEIFLLSDNLIGRQPSQEKIDALLDEIATVTNGKIEQINVIQFFTRDPKQVLKTIAERFNGTYSLIPAISESSAVHPGEDTLVNP